MLTISILTLILSTFASPILCSTKFLRPPEWNSDVDGDAGFGQNIRYNVGDTIQLLWETDLDKVELWLSQQIDSSEWGWMLDDASRTGWKAEWDVSEMLEGNEDSVYRFDLFDPRADYVPRIVAKTQYFNVTAQKFETTTAITLQTSTTMQRTSSTRAVTSAKRPFSTSTATDQSSESDAESNSDSGMSKGETAGAAVGATIGGLILLGAVGWLIWRRFGRSKRNTDASIVSQSHQGQINFSETKAELPGDPVVELYPAGYARSPPGLHEAP